MNDQAFHFKVIAGLSGSGISTALEALEDLEYFCVDNLPPELLPKLVELAQGAERLHHLAIGLDTRNVRDAVAVVQLLQQLKNDGHPWDLLYIEASDEALLRRFSITRRPHPAGRQLPLLEAIHKERLAMQPLREIASEILDTSPLNVHACKAAVLGFAHISKPQMGITVMSFGFRHGIPSEADLVWDVRFIKNPYFIAELRQLSGLDEPVREFVLARPETQDFLQRFLPLLEFALPEYAREGKSYLTLAIGCTGGRHRSVVIAEQIAATLSLSHFELKTRHRDMEKEF